MKKLSNVERFAPGSIREFVEIWTTAESAGPGSTGAGSGGGGGGARGEPLMPPPPPPPPPPPRGSSSARGYKKIYAENG